MEAPSAVIYGLSGLRLTQAEREFFGRVNPYGYILFARNCDNPAQVKALTQELRALAGRGNLPILIDQEGGRVARLKPPHWRACPPAGALAALGAARAKEAVYLNARLIGQELAALGITVDCAPVADIRVPGAHDIIGDRAYGEDPRAVAELAGEMARGLLESGVIPVLKHIPGHGRALCDSHLALPVVDAPPDVLERTDFAPFKALSHLPMAMTAHVVYTALDKARMATVSPAVIRYIREVLGFSGLLMSDDVSMQAMQGDYAQRTRAVLEAGCDIVLHCNGNMEEMEAIATALSPMTEEAAQRGERAFAQARPPGEFSVAAAEARLAGLMGMVAA